MNRLLFIFAATLLFLGQGVQAQSSRQLKKDSLWHVIARAEGAELKQARHELVRLYVPEVRKEGVIDTLRTLLDALEADARKAGDAKAEGVVRSNRLTALSNAGLNEEVIARAPEALEFLSAHGLWKDYYQTSMLLTDTYRNAGDLDRALLEAERFYDHAKQREDAAGMGLAQLALGRIYTAQRRFADAEACLRECIDRLEDLEPYLNYLATAYNRLAINLVGQEKYDEALAVARATEGVNRRYEQASHTPQPSAWFNLWLTYTDLYRQTGKFDEAQRYVDRIDSMSRGSVKMYKERGHILYGQGRFREALEMLDRAAEASPRNLEVKALKLMTLARMQEAEKAVELLSEVIEGMEKQHDEAFRSRLDEVRTQYEVDRYVAEKERNRNYFLFALGGCVLLLLLLFAAFYHDRVVTRKNIGLYKQIKEQDRLEEELARAQAYAVRSGEQLSEELDARLPGDPQQRDLVERLHAYLLADGNLIQAELGRDDLVTALGTNRSTLSEAVKVVTGKTLMEYLRTLQIEEARRMLDANPEFTIEAVACECGFNAPNTFYRLFRKQYGISPSEYRKIARTQGK